jgi:glycosyltransferase involved in cell wall biosynthesis
MGCPVIATSIGAPPETVLSPPGTAHEAATGWLVPPGDPLARAGRLREALTLADEVRQAMGVRARTHVLERFSLEGMKRQTLRVYDELIGSQLVRAFDQAQKPDFADAGGPSPLT